MPNWLHAAIWIIMILWSMLEIHAATQMAHFNKVRSWSGKPPIRYTRLSIFITALWLVLLVLWLCYSILG